MCGEGKCVVRVCGKCVWLVCVERIKGWVLVVGWGVSTYTPPPHKRTGLTASSAAQWGDEYGWGWGGGGGSRAPDWARPKYSPQTDDP